MVFDDASRAEIEAYIRENNIEELFHGLLVKVCQKRPSNAVQFLLDQLNEMYMTELIEEDDKSEEESDVEAPAAKPVVRKRRGAISAPARSDSPDGAAPREKVKKSEDQLALIDAALRRNCLSSSLDADQRMEIAQYMFKVEAAADEVVIKQGEPGDTFYVLAEGSCDIFVAKEVNGETVSNMVYQAKPGDSFGELALMYAAARAATIIATSPATLWAIDGDMYQDTVQQSVRDRRDKYEGFLAKVPVLSNLTHTERMTIADALVPVSYSQGDVILRQNEEGDQFFFIEKGTVRVSRTGEDGVEVDLAQLTDNNFFGEAALISRQPRNATVTAETDVKCVALDRSSFYRLLGPIQDIISRKCF